VRARTVADRVDRCLRVALAQYWLHPLGTCSDSGATQLRRSGRYDGSLHSVLTSRDWHRLFLVDSLCQLCNADWPVDHRHVPVPCIQSAICLVDLTHGNGRMLRSGKREIKTCGPFKQEWFRGERSPKPSLSCRFTLLQRRSLCVASIRTGPPTAYTLCRLRLPHFPSELLIHPRRSGTQIMYGSTGTESSIRTRILYFNYLSLRMFDSYAIQIQVFVFALVFCITELTTSTRIHHGPTKICRGRLRFIPASRRFSISNFHFDGLRRHPVDREPIEKNQG
jgi:hypothetical protein